MRAPRRVLTPPRGHAATSILLEATVHRLTPTTGPRCRPQEVPAFEQGLGAHSASVDELGPVTSPNTPRHQHRERVREGGKGDRAWLSLGA